MNESMLAAVSDPDDRRARVLAAHAGFEIIEAGSRVWFFDRRTRGPILALSIGAGVAALGLVNTVLVTLLQGWEAALIPAIMGLLSAVVSAVALKLLTRRRARPRAELAPLAILERSTGMVLDGAGRVLAPAAEVRATRGMMVSASAPSLLLRLPQGRRIEVYRAPLFGSVDHVLEALAGLGMRASLPPAC